MGRFEEKTLIKEIKMPDAGQTTDEAQIIAVKVKVGDEVKRGDILLEAETDKATLPVESYLAGKVLDIRVSEGDTVHAGDALFVIGKGKDAEEYVPGAGNGVPAAEERPEASPEEGVPRQPAGDGFLSIDDPFGEPEPSAPMRPASCESKPSTEAMPNAKEEARSRGIDITLVTPSNGKFVTRADVIGFAAHEQQATKDGGYDVVPLTGARKVIGTRMLQSCRDIPSWSATVRVDMAACERLRADVQSRYGVKVSYNDIIAKAVAAVAHEYPIFNARYENDEIHQYHHTNVGLAVAVEGSLLVPVVGDVDSKGLLEVSSEFKELVGKAREKRLAPSEMGFGSISISNLGMFGVHDFTPIINPPESCILGIGEFVVEPFWNGVAFEAHKYVYVTGVFDHRMIDGACAAQFLSSLKACLENPGLMLAR
ncbi:MAG: 2-oxo acid dehydrogenase subunit E2 [Atopobiaceae bacterium]|nr:2-oxo acid dehydrogenase subunit E2 [Atopobiaceae bacterium]MCI1389332.1 2-oxo acid dehydrogenase subunit E2 [Atopobiaceae bacterium]MCI1432395.1 2-oxo acid dehydrogenase subunit E2 [Atopobiaceae bacterium]MCI1470853.1 2-oxo acid dehydrogenase subunit E2 [Atopobiaceae bacterium]